MLKKMIAILITLAMLFSISLSAFADDNGQPPEPPSGDMAPPDGGNGQPPEKPDGNPPAGASGGNPPDGAPGGGFGGGTPPGGGTADFTYTAVTEITEAAEQAEQTYTSETADESALIINTADAVTITNPTVTKTGDSNGGDNCNFYGLNAGVLVMGGSTTTISGGIIETSASGANGVFSYGGNGGRNGAEGDGTTVNISDTIITTTGDGSGGIMTTGGGITHRPRGWHGCRGRRDVHHQRSGISGDLFHSGHHREERDAGIEPVRGSLHRGHELHHAGKL